MIWFIAGIMIGGIGGFVLMALLAIAGHDDRDVFRAVSRDPGGELAMVPWLMGLPLKTVLYRDALDCEPSLEGNHAWTFNSDCLECGQETRPVIQVWPEENKT